MKEAQHEHVHQGFMDLAGVLPLVKMKKSHWYALRKKKHVPMGQKHPLSDRRWVYSVEEIQALLRRMESERKAGAVGGAE